MPIAAGTPASPTDDRPLERPHLAFGVLGPLMIRDRRADAAPTAPKQRQVLALLLLNANRSVPMSTVIEELWGYVPPATAVSAVHTYIRHLRRAMRLRRMGDGPTPARLVTTERGYQLKVKPGELDLDIFSELVRAGKQSMAHYRHARAAQQLRTALELWRGPALADVLTGSVLQPVTAAIERARLDAVRQRVSADLEMGRHHELIGEASRLVHSNPDHEGFTAQLMLALYRSGRQADALAAFHRLRRVLSAEHATVPSAHVNLLYTDILNAHPRLEIPTPGNVGTALDVAARSANVDTALPIS